MEEAGEEARGPPVQAGEEVPGLQRRLRLLVLLDPEAPRDPRALSKAQAPPAGVPSQDIPVVPRSVLLEVNVAGFIRIDLAARAPKQTGGKLNVTTYSLHGKITDVSLVSCLPNRCLTRR